MSAPLVACAASRGVLLHVDAAQGAGKAPLDVQADAIDLLSLTAHKLHGPKGVGALCMRREPRLGLVPLQFGGGQERGLRSGTLPTHQIVGMGVACRIAREQMAADMARIAGLRAQLWQALSDLPGILLNGDPARRVAGILNVTVDDIEGETLLFALADLALSSGSACASLSAAAVLRPARAGSQRPPGPKLIAAEPGPLYHGRRHRSCRGTYPPRGAQAQGG